MISFTQYKQYLHHKFSIIDETGPFLLSAQGFHALIRVLICVDYSVYTYVEKLWYIYQIFFFDCPGELCRVKQGSLKG